MGRYDKFAETKIDKLIQEYAHNKQLATEDRPLTRPKASVISTQRGNRHMMDELQGE